MSETKITTPQLEAMLANKYQRDRYALFFDVPDAVGTSQSRRIDAVAVGLWQSVGRKIEGFELKVSRSDWLRELKNVNKADPFVAVCDHFWLVTGSPDIAKLEEIPASWGWMAATPHGIRIQRPATRLPGTGDMVPALFLIGLLRKMQGDMLNSPDVRAHIELQVQRGTADFDRRLENARSAAGRDRAAMSKRIADFEKESGIDINHWGLGDVGVIVNQLRKVSIWSGNGLAAIPEVLASQVKQLRNLLEKAEEAHAAVSSHPALAAIKSASDTTPEAQPDPTAPEVAA